MGTPWLVVSARSLESTRTRSSDPLPGLKLIGGLPLPAFGEALVSVRVLLPTMGWGGTTAWPVAGSRAASPNSAGLPALNGIAPARRSAPAILAVAASAMPESGLTLGPLAVDLADVAAASLAEAGFFVAFVLLGLLRFETMMSELRGNYWGKDLKLDLD